VLNGSGNDLATYLAHQRALVPQLSRVERAELLAQMGPCSPACSQMWPTMSKRTSIVCST
jgi:hypothetical protein